LSTFPLVHLHLSLVLPETKALRPHAIKQSRDLCNDANVTSCNVVLRHVMSSLHRATCIKGHLHSSCILYFTAIILLHSVIFSGSVYYIILCRGLPACPVPCIVCIHHEKFIGVIRVESAGLEARATWLRLSLSFLPITSLDSLGVGAITQQATNG